MRQPRPAVLETCEYLVEAGAADTDAEIVLREACNDGNVDLVKRMLQRGTRVRKLPLCDNIEILKLFIETGYDFKSQPDRIAELQERAISRGDVPLLAYLVDTYGLLLPFSEFSSPAWNIIRGEKNQVEILRYLVENCAFNIDTVYPTYAGSSEWINILQQAATLENNPDVVELLLKEGASTDCPGLQYTALMSVLKEGSHGIRTRTVSVIQLLLDYGADVDGSRATDRDPNGQLKPHFQKTPLLYAIYRNAPGSLDAVKLLIKHGADINRGIISPLRLARILGNGEIENLLIQHGAVDNSDLSYTLSDFRRDLFDRATFHQEFV
ncbi:hypothetical protein VTN77DRAFT_7418 [Rasamsonia byssochlamydoides]|uniref:uncharacterized protein n=1 Tax=Rasamsonia byssochlamydoides TaxID=89139 RepID=UPI003744084B